MTQIVRDKSFKGGQATIAWIVALITLGYMLPWAIAASRGKANSGAIGVLNLFLGWTLIGWIVALVMACGAHQVVGTAPAPTTPVVAMPGIAPPPVGSPPGWLNDGTGAPAGTLRWWDGSAWTENVHTPEAVAAGSDDPPTQSASPSDL